MESTHSYSLKILDNLIKHQRIDGSMYNPRTGERAPDSHYNYTSFALACYRAKNITGCEKYLKSANKAIDYYLSIPETSKGHPEFNSYAILSLLNEKNELDSDIYKLAELLEEVKFSKHTYTGANNWILLKCVCKKLMCDNDLGINYLEKGKNYYTLLLLKHWQQQSGLIIDNPSFRVAPIESPLSYHSKLLSLAVELYTSYGYSFLKEICSDAIKFLQEIQSCDGSCLYYGRSWNSLFGYTSLISAIDTVQDIEDFDINGLEKFKKQILKFFSNSFNANLVNSFPLVNGELADPVDTYIYDTVYCSYAAMKLLGIEDMNIPENINGCDNRDSEEECTNLKHNSFEIFRNTKTTFVTHTNGQIRWLNYYKEFDGPPKSLYPDPRYAGMVPHNYIVEGQTIIPELPPLYEIDSYPYLPNLVIEDDHYVPIVWEECETDEHQYKFDASGHFVKIKKQDVKGPNYNSIENQCSSYKYSVKNKLNRIAKRFHSDIAFEKYTKKITEIGVNCHRTIVLDPETGILMLGTKLNSDNEFELIPGASIVTSRQKDIVESNMNPKCCYERNNSFTILYDKMVADELITTHIFDPHNNLIDHYIEDGQVHIVSDTSVSVYEL